MPDTDWKDVFGDAHLRESERSGSLALRRHVIAVGIKNLVDNGKTKGKMYKLK